MAGRKTGNITTVRRRLRPYLLMGLIAVRPMPLLLRRGPRVIENDGGSLRGSDMVPRSPGLLTLLLFILSSPEIQPASH